VQSLLAKGHARTPNRACNREHGRVRVAATHCNTPQHTATHPNTPLDEFMGKVYSPRDMPVHRTYRTEHATENMREYAALQHAATHCNTPQHTATHCNTLQRRKHPHNKPECIVTETSPYALGEAETCSYALSEAEPAVSSAMRAVPARSSYEPPPPVFEWPHSRTLHSAIARSTIPHSLTTYIPIAYPHTPLPHTPLPHSPRSHTPLPHTRVPHSPLTHDPMPITPAPTTPERTRTHPLTHTYAPTTHPTTHAPLSGEEEEAMHTQLLQVIYVYIHK